MLHPRASRLVLRLCSDELPPVPRSVVASSGKGRYALGHSLLDRYLEFVAGRVRPNTLRAVAFDLKTFFAVVGKDPTAVEPADVFELLPHQRGDRPPRACISSRTLRPASSPAKWLAA
jgi:hypothetical protein